MALPLVAPAPPPSIGKDSSGPRYARAWTVIASSGIDSLDVLSNELGINQGVAYEDEQGVSPDPYCTLRSFSVDAIVPAPLAGTGLYSVTAQYAYPQSRGVDPPTVSGDTRWHMEREIVTEPIDIDADGNPIDNGVGELLDPPVTRERTYRTLVAEKIVYYFTLAAAEAFFSGFDDTVNASMFQGAPAGSLLCNVNVSRASDVPVLPGSLTIPIMVSARFRERKNYMLHGVAVKGWQEARLKKGRRVKGSVVGGIQQYTPIKDSEGRAIEEPVLLNAAGTAPLPTTGTPAVLRFNRYPEADHNAMGF